MISPDGEILDVMELGASFGGELVQCSVVVQTGHRSEVLFREILGVMCCDHAVGVRGVSDGKHLHVSGCVVIDGLSGADKDFPVILE